MARVTLKYVHRVQSGGTVYYYFRRSLYRERLPDDPQSAEFMEAYQLHLRVTSNEAIPEAKNGSLAHVIGLYKRSPEFTQLKGSTKKDYLRHLEAVAEKAGSHPISAMTQPHVYKMRDALSDKPRTANYRISVLKKLMSFAVERGFRKDNPVTGVRKLKESADKHRPWEDYEIEAFQAAWAPGTKERVFFELLLNTGQRGQDIAKMTRGQYRNGEISVVQQKTGERVWIPVSDNLKAVLDPWIDSLLAGQLLLFANKRGAAFNDHYFNGVFAKATRKAGLTGVTKHGLRYTFATMARELDIPLEDVSAITGHRTEAMARHYTRKRRQARAVITKLNTRRKNDEYLG